jgi:hypothetical protein
LNAPTPEGGLPAGWWRRVRHDLRSAIAPMRMAVQLLRAGRIDPAEREEALQVLDRQLEQLLAAVEDVGDLLHADTGALALSPARSYLTLLPDVVCGRGALLRELGTRKVQLRCEPCAAEPAVMLDAARVSALVEFLLLRMAAHSAPGTELVLSVLHDGEGASLRLSGAADSLARDPELLYLQGVDAGGGEPGLRSMVVRELLRAGNMRLSTDGEGALRLRFAPDPA